MQTRGKIQSTRYCLIRGLHNGQEIWTGAGGREKEGGVLFVFTRRHGNNRSSLVVQTVPWKRWRIFRRRGGQFPSHADNLPIAGRRLDGRVGQGAVAGCREGARVDVGLVMTNDDGGQLRGQVSWARGQAGGGSGGDGRDNVPGAAECLFIFHRDLGAAAWCDLDWLKGGPMGFTET